MTKRLSGSRLLPLLLCGLLAGCGGNAGKVEVEPEPRPGAGQPQVKPAADKPDARLTSRELYAAHKQDRQAADAKYRDKTLELTGQVHSFAYNEFDGRIALHLEGGGDFAWVACYLRAGEREPWARAVPGQEVVVRGRYVEHGFPALLDAVLVKTGPYQGVVLTAEQLAEELTKDPDGARERYKNKHLALTGVLLAKEANDAGAYSFFLQGNDRVAPDCRFTAFEKKLVEKFIPGDRVKLVGKFDPIFSDADGFVLLFCMPVLSESSKPGSATKPPAVTLQDLKNRKKADIEVEDQAAALLNKAGAGAGREFGGAWRVQLAEKQFNADGTLKPEVAQALTRLKRIYELALYDAPISDAGMAALRPLRTTERLMLLRTKITDAGVAALSKMTGLRHLELSNGTGGKVSMGDASLAHLQGLTGLQWLDLCNGEVTDQGLAHLKNLRELDNLALSANPIQGPGLLHLRGLTKLTHLSLAECPLTDAAGPHLAALPNLTDLTLIWAPLSDAGVKALASAPRLRRLDLTNTKITDQALPALAGIKTLKWLELSRTEITDAALEALATMPALESVTVVECPRLTPAGIEKLKKARPKLVVRTQF
jgi:hypothetical protein